MTIRRLVPLAAGALLLASAGCRDQLTAPPAAPPRSAPAVSTLMEVTISGIGTAQMSASARPPQGPGGASLALSPPADGDGGGDGTIQLDPLSTGSFTVGERGVDGERYIYATFRVRNAQSDGTAYDTPRQNLTFVAASTGGTLEGTAVASLRRFDGTPAATGIALGVLPSGAVHQQRDGDAAARFADVLQVFTEAEVAAIDAAPGTRVLPYGFVVSHATDPASRTLPGSPAPGQFDGVVTFAYRIPLQSSSAADPFTVSIIVMAMEDDETRLTQSIEEQGAGRAAFEARAAALGATTVTLFGGGSYAGAATARRICEVRTAGLAGAPTATLSSGAPCNDDGMHLGWLGGVSSEWWDPANWISATLPVAIDTVSLGAADHDPALGDHDVALARLVITDSVTLDLAGRGVTLTGDLDAPTGTLRDGTLWMTGAAATLHGTVDRLQVVGGVRLGGPARATGAVRITGSLATDEHPLTISIP